MNEKIMIVDDDQDIREVIQVLLSSEGYNVIEASNGKEALELVDDDTDLIILDVMMPEMNGYQACVLLREKTKAPILFLTAKGQDSDKTLGFSSGGGDYLTKPFAYNELNGRVIKHVSGFLRRGGDDYLTKHFLIMKNGLLRRYIRKGRIVIRH